MSFIPGSFVRSTDEIITAIETGNFRVDRIQPFVHYFFDDLDGKSSARVVDQLIIHSDEEDDDTKPDEVKREDLGK
jgi:CDP-ribitol ribitolphosphotransferase